MPYAIHCIPDEKQEFETGVAVDLKNPKIACWLDFIKPLIYEDTKMGKPPVQMKAWMKEGCFYVMARWPNLTNNNESKNNSQSPEA